MQDQIITTVQWARPLAGPIARAAQRLLLCAGLASGLAFGAEAQTAPATPSESTPAAVPGAIPVPAPIAATIDRLTGGQAKILGAFKSKAGLVGIALSMGPGRNTIIYATPDGKYLIQGVVIDAQGNNLTQMAQQQYLPKPPGAAEDFAAMDKAHTFLWGQESAKKELWIVFDPNCIYCHKMYEDLKSYVADGTLKVHILEVGVVKQSSTAKAAAIMAAKDPAAALVVDEEKFDVTNEEGGIKPDMSNADAVKKVNENNAWMSAQGISGTPFLLYYAASSGQPEAIGGYVKNTKTLVANIGPAVKK